MNIKKAFNKYLDFKELHSSNGDYEYSKSHCKVILDYIQNKNILNTKNIDNNFIDNYIKFKKSKLNSINTINKEVEMLRRVFRYNNILNKNLESFKRIKFKKKRFDKLKDNELRILVNYYNNFDLNDILKLTNYLLFYIMFYTGCRRTEASNIKIQNMDLDNNCIYLDVTKNGLPRIVFFQDKIKNSIINYIQTDESREYFFFNAKTGGNLSPENITAIFRYTKKQLKLDKYSPHMLRHTMASMLVDNDCNIVTVQHLLGHSNIKTTMNYIHLSSKKNKKDYDKHFPKI
jgi:integrase/recombinase XerD